jgi:hypothetical protein
MLRPLRFLRLFAVTAALHATAGEPVRFNRDIRPILSDKCFACHGPDKNKRDSGLRLDIREEAIADRDGVRAIVPGKPDQSDAFIRLTSHDQDEMMPPPKAKLPPITKDEAALIRRWIEEGAPYEKHWSFTSLGPIAAPSFDALVEQSLATRGLALQPEADPHTLIRRLSFDLTGLPPTPEEVQAFVNECRDGSSFVIRHSSWSALVDRLLASPHYGERMAVDWLDVARYADSYGYQVDRPREVWPWRDWVISAFNRNLPFDQFLTWQLAGDLLPHPTDEQILATAFNRLHQQESEGGSVEEEYRVEYVADRVQTVATAFLGLTFECARCHDHKYDPITQKDYFSLFAMFQNIDEAGLYSFFTPSPPTPTLPLLDDAEKAKLAELKGQVTAQEKAIAALRESKRDAFAAWLTARPARVELSGEIGRFPFDFVAKGKLANTAQPDQPATLKGDNRLVPARDRQALEFTGDDPVDLPFGNFARHEPFSVALWLKTPDVKDRAVIFHRSRAWTDAASRGYELLIEEGKLKWSLIHFWPGNAISIRTRNPVRLNTWTHVVVTNDGSSRAGGLRLFVNGRPAPVEVIRDSLTKDIRGGGGDNISLGERFRDRGFKGGLIDDFRVFARALTPLEALAATDEAAARAVLEKPSVQLTADERALLHDYHLATADPSYQKQLDTLKAARAALVQAAEATREIMVMRELPTPKKAFTLFRGEYNQRRDEVTADVPTWLLPLPDGAPRNRLGLAQWLTDPRHPLTARVLVNRYWQSLFGRGLVKTSEDFGSQSSKPVYPEVLDWLAQRYIQSGWDTKALLKTIVTSRTYRQRSLADARLMTDDPDNDLLARGPRFRLNAEMIRDNALAAAGLLSPTIGGKPVFPYEMTEAFKPEKVSAGDGTYRRSLYTNWRRTGPPPAMLAFDAPRRAVCIAKRERTDSPLQALILLNGTQYVEAARVLGEKLHREANGHVRSMIDHGFLRCLSREPDEKERAILERLYTEQLTHFTASPKAAEALLKNGGANRDLAIPAAHAAAATILAQALLNHDACVVKR